MTLARNASTLAAVAALALLVGCSGKTIGDDLSATPYPTLPADGGNDGPPTCTEIAPACDPGDEQFGSEQSCTSAGGDYCYSRAASCGSSLVWCGHRTVVQCTAIPTCDEGDTQVPTCPTPPPGPDNGFSCYPRTLCGSTIQCLHRDACKALPACNPGDKEVVDIDTCSKPGVSCYSRTACNFTIHCYTP